MQYLCNWLNDQFMVLWWLLVQMGIKYGSQIWESNTGVLGLSKCILFYFIFFSYFGMILNELVLIEWFNIYTFIFYIQMKKCCVPVIIMSYCPFHVCSSYALSEHLKAHWKTWKNVDRFIRCIHFVHHEVTPVHGHSVTFLISMKRSIKI